MVEEPGGFDECRTRTFLSTTRRYNAHPDPQESSCARSEFLDAPGGRLDELPEVHVES
ncbi:MAG: hypothetical protein R2710_25020 [Acidimicrobiales bacterium]